MTRSTDSTPICRPQLPPEIVTNAGALQALAVRQVATPLPPLPPKTKPPLTILGTTAMHFACSSTSSGIPLSGAPIISCITVVALSSRSVASSRADPAQPSVPRLKIAIKSITLFMDSLISSYSCIAWGCPGLLASPSINQFCPRTADVHIRRKSRLLS
jgi:hypothetical protein